MKKNQILLSLMILSGSCKGLFAQQITRIEVKNTDAKAIHFLFEPNGGIGGSAETLLDVNTTTLMGPLGWGKVNYTLSTPINLLPLGVKYRFDLTIRAGKAVRNYSADDLQILPNDLKLIVEKDEINLE